MPQRGNRWLWSDAELDRAYAILALATIQPRTRELRGQLVIDPPGVFLLPEIRRAAVLITGQPMYANSLQRALLNRGRLVVADASHPRRQAYRLQGLP